MIDPRTAMLAVPTYNHQVMAEAAGFWIACAQRFFAAVSFKQGVSSVSLARNLIAETFLQSSFEWLICQDQDIIASPQDFQLLMEPIQSFDYATHESEPAGDHPTRIECSGLKPPDPTDVGYAENYGRQTPPPLPCKITADAIVSAEYSYKDDALRPCRYGLGFTRIHRSVFEKIRELKHEDGSPRTWQCLFQGRLMTDFFPAGPFISQVIPNGEWKGEDIGFFALASLAGIVPRIETRTRLWHVGTKAYPYLGADQSGAN